MPYHDPKEIIPDDFKALKSWSLEEVDGAPVLHMSVELHQHREYDAEPTSLFLPSIDPRRLLAPEPVDPVTEETNKQEVVQAPVTEPETPKKKSKGTASDANQEPVPPVGEEQPKTDDSAPAAPPTGQGG